MSSPSVVAIRDDDPMSSSSSPGPRAGGPAPRRSFTPAQKLDHLAAYEDAITRNQGGAYLREHGIYSSQVTEWRKLRDAGVLAGKKPGEKVGRLTPDQAEIARLRRQLGKAEERLATTEVALSIMGKAHELLEQLSKSSRDEPPHTTF
jgi:transposase